MNDITTDTITITTTGVVSPNSILIGGNSYNSVSNVLDKFALNELVVEHKVQTQELMKLKEADLNYADHIKYNLTNKVAERIMPRMTFTKSQSPDIEEHNFRGRIWVFTKSELDELIKELRNV
jgi:hypothetical protein